MRHCADTRVAFQLALDDARHAEPFGAQRLHVDDARPAACDDVAPERVVLAEGALEARCAGAGALRPRHPVFPTPGGVDEDVRGLRVAHSRRGCRGGRSCAPDGQQRDPDRDRPERPEPSAHRQPLPQSLLEEPQPLPFVLQQIAQQIGPASAGQHLSPVAQSR